MVAHPVGDHHPVCVCFDPLHNAVYLVPLHRAWHQPVEPVRAAHPVRLHQLHPQVVWLAHLPFHRQQGDFVPVHQVSHECELLELVEVIYPLCVAHRSIRPQRKFPDDLRLQPLHFLLTQPQILPVDLRRRHQSACDHIGSHGFQCRRRSRDAHIGISAPLAQHIDVVLDVLFRAAAVELPAPHALFGQVRAVVSISAVDYRQGGSGRRPLCRMDRGNGNHRPVKDVRFRHACPPYRSRATAR